MCFYLLSLRGRARRRVLREHHDLRFSFGNAVWRIKNVLTNRIGAIWLVLITMLLFVAGITIFDIGQIKIVSVTSSDVTAIITGRLLNLSAIVSITIVVIGFIINNSVHKDKESLHLLLKHAYFYPVLYSSLTLIGLLAFVLFVFRNIENYNQELWLNIAATSTYLFIMIVAASAILFVRMIGSLSPYKLYDILEEEIAHYIPHVCLEKLIERESRSELTSIMESLGIQQNTISHDDFILSQMKVTYVLHEEVERDSRVLRNIYFWWWPLRKFWTRSIPNLRYNPVGINESVDQDYTLFSRYEGSEKWLTKRFNGSLSFRRSIRKPRYYDLRELLDSKHRYELTQNTPTGVKRVGEIYCFIEITSLRYELYESL